MPVSEGERGDVPGATHPGKEVLPHAPDDGGGEAGETQAAEPGGRSGNPRRDCNGRTGGSGREAGLQAGFDIGVLPAIGVEQRGQSGF